MSAENLRDILANWPSAKKFPQVLYTIPNGSNPTGASMNLERKKDIYSVGNIQSDRINASDRLFRLLKNMIC